MTENGLDPSTTLMVGDRLDTDILFGNAGGVSTALVLTGVSQRADLEGLKIGEAGTPTYLMERLGVLFPAVTEAMSKAGP